VKQFQEEPASTRITRKRIRAPDDGWSCCRMTVKSDLIPQWRKMTGQQSRQFLRVKGSDSYTLKFFETVAEARW
jgi:hypothetical protein